MYHYAPIYSRIRPTEMAPLIEAYKAFNPGVEIGPLTDIKINGLPKAIWKYYEKQIGKSGREAAKKLKMMSSAGLLKSIGGNKITHLNSIIIHGIGELFHKFADGSKVVMIYSWGMIVDGEYNIEAMRDFLPVPLDIEVRRI